MIRDANKNSPDGQNASEPRLPSGQATRSHVAALKESVGDAMDRGKADIAFSANAARGSFDEDFSKLKADLAGLQETVAKFANETSVAAASTVKDVGRAMASEAGSAAGEISANATAQAKTFASELESIARRNPLGTLAGTLAIGVLVGMMTRSRRV